MTVYFAESCGYVKIGYSANPTSRVTSITRLGDRPADVPEGADADLIGWVPGDVKRERGFHMAHGANHVAGEWFRLDVDMVRELIWDDPSGVDVKRMSAIAALTLLQSPDATRADVEAAGIPILARPIGEILGSWPTFGLATKEAS